ncbi:MAG TPA: HEAT repeat domain-containing protein [bacterium]|nr:HEAT repeat domain-containing protein [bacterium]
MLFRRLFFVACLAMLVLPTGLTAGEDNDAFDTAQFFKSIVESDVIFVGEYLQGGQTKGRVRRIKNIFGSVPDETIITEIDNQKYWRNHRFSYQPRTQYIFIAKKDGDAFALHPDSISVPVMSDKINFSLGTPYYNNFWQLFNLDLFETVVAAAREKVTGGIQPATEEKFQELFKKYIAAKEINSLKALIPSAAQLSLRLDETEYGKLVTQTDMLGCLAVKFSAQVMGDLFFKKNVLSKLKTLPQDAQIAAAKCAATTDAKESVRELSDILKAAELYNPASSECFPEEAPASNKKAFLQTIIELDTPDTKKIIARELSTEDVQWLSSILLTLSEYEGADLIELALAASISEHSSERKIEYASYFDRIKSKESAAVLIALFEKNDNLFWKKIILSTLGKYGYEESLPFLIKVMQESQNEEVRTTAAIATGSLDKKEGIVPLYDFIKREKSILAKSIAVDALAQIADKSVQAYLKKIITEEDNKKIREQAANALEDNLFILRYGRKKQ